jgi:alpha-aminoadipate carrier protein LysW
MAICPDCGLEFYLDEDGLEVGDVVQCDECGVDLEVVSIEGEPKLALISEEEEEEEEEEDEDFDDNGFYDSENEEY